MLADKRTMGNRYLNLINLFWRFIFMVLNKGTFFLYELSNAACLIWYVVIKAVINY